MKKVVTPPPPPPRKMLEPRFRPLPPGRLNEISWIRA